MSRFFYPGQSCLGPKFGPGLLLNNRTAIFKINVYFLKTNDPVMLMLMHLLAKQNVQAEENIPLKCSLISLFQLELRKSSQ